MVLEWSHKHPGAFNVGDGTLSAVVSPPDATKAATGCLLYRTMYYVQRNPYLKAADHAAFCGSGCLSTSWVQVFYHGLEALAHRCSRVCSVSPQKYCPVPLAPMLEHVSIDIGT